MTRQFVRTVLIAGLTALGSLTLTAQDRSATAKIPFAFRSNHKSMPAGDYRIDRLSEGGLFRLADYDAATAEFVPAPVLVDAKNHDEGRLTFACYQGQCVLSQIAMPGSSVAYKRSQSAVDNDLQRKLGMATMVNIRLAH